MKQLILVAFALVIVTNGCMETRLEVHVEDGWSGTIEADLKLQESMYQMALQGGDVLFPDEESHRQRAELDGGRLESYENRVEGSYRLIRFETWYPDLRKTNDSIMSFSQDGDVCHLRFGLGNLAPLVERLTERIEVVAPIIQGMKIEVRARVPNLTDTNLERVDVDTVRYQMDWDAAVAGKGAEEMAATLQSLTNEKTVVFEME